MKLIISGPPGSGKGTRSKMISQEIGIPHISTGDLVRKEIKDNTELGSKINQYFEKGLLVPDNIIFDMLKARLALEDCKNGFILDGFPRTIEQANLLAKIVEMDLFLNLAIRDEIIIDRMTSRRTCKDCGAIFNIKTIVPKQEGVCDFCSGALVQRADEKPEIIADRLKIYEEKTKPLINFYKNQNIFEEIDGELDVKDENFKKQLFEKLKINF